MNNKHPIIFICNNEKDHKTLIEALSKHETITWGNDTFIANIKRENNTFVFNISKSKIQPPKRLRL